MKTINYFLALFIVVIAITGCKEEQKPAPAPVSTLTDGDYSIPVINKEGYEYLLNQKDGKVHIVNLWATWCAPCLKELPYFEQINKDFKDKGVDVKLISVDDESMHKRVLKYAKKNLKSDVVIFPNGNSEDLMPIISKNWQNGSIPVTLIYNDNARFFIEGETNYDKLKEQIEKFK